MLPIVKAIEFFFIALTSWLIGESRITLQTALGMLCVVVGTALCLQQDNDAASHVAL